MDRVQEFMFFLDDWYFKTEIEGGICSRGTLITHPSPCPACKVFWSVKAVFGLRAMFPEIRTDAAAAYIYTLWKHQWIRTPVVVNFPGERRKVYSLARILAEILALHYDVL